MTPSRHEAAVPGRTAPVTVVLLPAAFTAPEDFIAAGFVSAVRERALDVDLSFGALRFRHVNDRAVVDEVLAELVAPAQARGSAVWLGGISLGGYVALSCAERAARAPVGLCLIAPYLGSHIVTDEIARTGLAAWRAPEALAEDDERRVWRYLKEKGPEPPVFLGLGSEDRFGARHRVLAAALDPRDVVTVPGGHDWPTWRRVWENFLDDRLRACHRA